MSDPIVFEVKPTVECIHQLAEHHLEAVDG